MAVDFRLLMIGAMYENGGNTTHRFLDGHPGMFVYPFESQLGTRLVTDHLSSVFPVKYRWPVFALDAGPQEDYRAIIDEECKIRSRTPHVSKFRHMPFDFSDEERLSFYKKHVSRSGRSRAANVAAFFRATFEAWKDVRRTGKERFYVGYSPIITVDAERILTELPQSHVLHVVRNPWSAYADHKKRPVPMSLRAYMLGWTLCQYYALALRERFPERLHLVRLEDELADPLAVLGGVCRKLGLEAAASLKTPTWNGKRLKEVYPWGTIRKATVESNLATGRELSGKETEEVRAFAHPYLAPLGYEDHPA
ncbi:MAG: sulfotransferase [Elusimicrobiota bacterium]|jgi:hypothetical protein